MGIVAESAREFRVEVLSRDERLQSDEIGYLSLLFQELRSRLGVLRIDGSDDHPILKMSRRESIDGGRSS